MSAVEYLQEKKGSLAGVHARFPWPANLMHVSGFRTHLCCVNQGGSCRCRASNEETRICNVEFRAMTIILTPTEIVLIRII